MLTNKGKGYCNKTQEIEKDIKDAMVWYCKSV